MGCCLSNAFLKWNHRICDSLKLTHFSLGFKVCVMVLHWHHILPFVYLRLLIKWLHFTSLWVSSGVSLPKYLHQHLLFIFSCSQSCGCLQGSSCVSNRCVWWMVYSHMTAVVHGGRKGGGSPKAGVVACCELPNVSDRSCLTVLCKNCSWPLSHLFGIFLSFLNWFPHSHPYHIA